MKKSKMKESRVPDPGRAFQSSDLQGLVKVNALSASWDEGLKEASPLCVSNSGCLKASADWNWGVDFLAKHVDESALLQVYASRDGQTVVSQQQGQQGAQPFVVPDGNQKKLLLTAKQLQAVWRVPGRKYKYMFYDAFHTAYGEEIKNKCKSFNWTTAERIRTGTKSGAFDRQVLTVRQAGIYRPAHYEMCATVHTQLVGTRQVMLFDPSAFSSLYPYPCTHPWDTTSQLGENLEKGTYPGPDFPRLPFAAAHGYVVELCPGDALFVPKLWFMHEMASKEESVSMMLRCQPSAKEQLPVGQESITGAQHVLVRRALEDAMCDHFGVILAHKFWLCIEKGFVPEGSDLSEMNNVIQHLVQKLSTLVDTRNAGLLLRELAVGRFWNQDYAFPELQDFRSSFEGQ
eukprot:Rhum_TRINITY_DN2011_c0_g2::Rhum_TRINITY_DN2011_c0_g2_i1::g.5463::m.5463/K18055/HIF1AN; hypoxia-inducible factor 1-alpha inhibitor (HIF hydroxylase)